MKFAPRSIARSMYPVSVADSVPLPSSSTLANKLAGGQIASISAFVQYICVVMIFSTPTAGSKPAPGEPLGVIHPDPPGPGLVPAKKLKNQEPGQCNRRHFAGVRLATGPRL